MHPYANLPERSFWRSGVSGRLWSEIDFVPEVPFTLAPSDRVATAGSCFAQHIARNLAPLGLSYFVSERAPELLSQERRDALQYGVFSARYGNVYTVRQLRQLIEFAFGEQPDLAPVDVDANGRWFDLVRPTISPDGFASLYELQADRASHLHCVRQLFQTADCFVFTLGLTEAWYDQPSGVVLPVCPGTRAGTFDPAAHKFVKFRFADVARDLQWCVDYIGAINPAMRWIFTVSPVALAATATRDHVLVATAASKAVLRAAVDEVCMDNEACAYFPSYEICSSAASFGQLLDADLRNVSPRGVRLVMRVFGETFGAHGALVDTEAVASPAADGAEDLRQALRGASAAICDEVFNDPGMLSR